MAFEAKLTGYPKLEGSDDEGATEWELHKLSLTKDGSTALHFRDNVSGTTFIGHVFGTEQTEDDIYDGIYAAERIGRVEYHFPNSQIREYAALIVDKMLN